MRYLYTIKKEDVGKHHIKTEGQIFSITSLLGYIQKQDIGKRIYLKIEKYSYLDNKGKKQITEEKLLYIENQEQYQKRLLTKYNLK